MHSFRPGWGRHQTATPEALQGLVATPDHPVGTILVPALVGQVEAMPAQEQRLETTIEDGNTPVAVRAQEPVVMPAVVAGRGVEGDDLLDRLRLPVWRQVTVVEDAVVFVGNDVDRAGYSVTPTPGQTLPPADTAEQTKLA